MTQESMVGVPGQEATRIRTPDGQIIVEALGPPGTGPAVVCVHGLTANRATWRPLAARLPHRHLILVDLLGRGESKATPAARFDLESEARRLITVVDALELDRPILAGHSHGSAIAVAAASRINARGLMLVNPVTPYLPKPAVLGPLRCRAARRLVAPCLRLFRRQLTRYILVRRVFADRSEVSAEVVSSYADPWADPARAIVLPRILADWEPTELKRWDAPAGRQTWVITGAEDRRIDPVAARRWADRLGARFELAAGCGHSAPEERTDLVAAALESLLETIRVSEQKEQRDDQERSVDPAPGT